MMQRSTSTLSSPSSRSKFFVTACVLAAALQGNSVTAFTPSNPVPASLRSVTPAPLAQSSTTQPQEPTTEQQATQPSKSWNDDGFVFGLEGSGLERPTGRTSQIVVDGDSLETTPFQRALVSVTMAGHAAFGAVALQEMCQVNNHGDVGATALQATALAVSSWLLADFGSGVLHWSVDNYGNGKTPVMGSIIAAFQGHHAAPWTITERGFCNNVYKLCLPFGLAPMTLISFATGPATTFFFVCFCVLEILSQEFHKWSHQRKSETPGWVNQLQNLGLTVGRKPHALHHMAPYEGNYCIISGFCNPFLDESGFFRRLEHLVYNINGVESNAWKLDPALRERTLAGDYTLPKAT